MVHASLDVDQHLGDALVLGAVAVALRLRLVQVRLQVLTDLPARGAAGGAVLELVHEELHLLLLLLELVDALLVVLRQREQVVLGLLLGQELLDHLVHVQHTRGLLDAAEGILELLHAELLLLRLVVAHGARELGHGRGGLKRQLPSAVQVLLLPEHALALLEALVHLHALLHQGLLPRTLR